MLNIKNIFFSLLFVFVVVFFFHRKNEGNKLSDSTVFGEIYQEVNREVRQAEDRSKDIPLYTESFYKDISTMIAFSHLLIQDVETFKL